LTCKEQLKIAVFQGAEANGHEQNIPTLDERKQSRREFPFLILTCLTRRKHQGEGEIRPGFLTRASGSGHQ
jgi:hypothetical protein